MAKLLIADPPQGERDASRILDRFLQKYKEENRHSGFVSVSVRQC